MEVSLALLVATVAVALSEQAVADRKAARIALSIAKLSVAS